MSNNNQVLKTEKQNVYYGNISCSAHQLVVDFGSSIRVLYTKQLGKV